MDPPNTNFSAAGPSSGAPPSGTPPKYVPQFSAATEMILKRINSGAGTSNLSALGMQDTPEFQEMKRNVMMGMKTHMNMELPTTPINPGARAGGPKRTSVGSAASANAPGSITVAGAGTPNSTGRQRNGTQGSNKGKKPRAKAGQKRKRARESSDETESDSDGSMSKLGGDDSDSDGTSSITHFPKVTQSGRQINKPEHFVPEVKESSARKRGPSRKALEQTLCKRCGRGHSPANNQIVFCDGCNAGYHQMCHDPPVSDEAVQDADAAWFCVDCTKKRRSKSKSASVNVSANVSTTSEPPPLVSWQDRSLEDKRAYLSYLPQSDLINTILTACTMHPDLPIFPSVIPPHILNHATHPNAVSQPIPLNPSSNRPPPLPQSGTPGLFSRADSNPTATMNFIRKIAGPSNSNSKNIQPPAEPAQDDKSRESTPASPPYPKVGNGLMAKLGPDDQDMEWLVDDGDFESFSHEVFGGLA